MQTKQVVYDEIAEKNENLPEAIKPIASVIGSVSALYHSKSYRVYGLRNIYFYELSTYLINNISALS